MTPLFFMRKSTTGGPLSKKNIIMDNILLGDIYVRAKELHFSIDAPQSSVSPASGATGMWRLWRCCRGFSRIDCRILF